MLHLVNAIEHYLKVYAGKPDCTEMKMNWIISISEQSGKIKPSWISICAVEWRFDFTLVSLHIVTVSIDDHSLLNHFVWVRHCTQEYGTGQISCHAQPAIRGHTLRTFNPALHGERCFLVTSVKCNRVMCRKIHLKIVIIQSGGI